MFGDPDKEMAAEKRPLDLGVRRGWLRQSRVMRDAVSDNRQCDE